MAARRVVTLATELEVVVDRLELNLRLLQPLSGGLSLPQLSVLDTLHRAGPLTPTELARLESVVLNSMKKFLAPLLAQGLVDRTPHSTDLRSEVVSLTDSGRTAMSEFSTTSGGWLASRVQALEPLEHAVVREATSILLSIANTATPPTH